MKVDLARARAHWHLRSGLASSLASAPDEVIAQTGWLRTLGGVDVYLSAAARVPGLRRAQLDALVDAARLRVVPAVRGCIYLVPAAHVPLALRVASEAWRKGTDKDLKQLGSSWKEVEALGAEVTKTLKAGAMTTDRLRKALPADPPRGVLPIALRDLEFKHVVERTLEGGRLDTERYLWRLAASKPKTKVPDEAVERGAALARIFAGFAGPTPLADFAWWSGMTQRDARAAIERAGLEAIEVDGYSKEAWVVPEDVEVLKRAAAPSTAVSLLSFEDNYLMRRTEALGDAKHIATRTVIVGGHLAGIWEMDPDAQHVLWATFAPVPRAAREAVDRLATETGNLLGDLGHARSFSLDTEEEVRKRASEVARVAGEAHVHRDRPVRNKPKPPARRRRKS